VNRKKNPQRPTFNSQRSVDSPPVALTIAGSDSSAGAGIQADLKTFSALGVYGVTAVTCVVAEIPGKVSRIEPVSANVVREQIQLLANSFPIAAIKTGLLCSVEIISTAAKTIRAMNNPSEPRIPLVIDPVFVATSGVPLLESAGIETYERELFPLASLITPNLDEAGRLIGSKIEDLQSMRVAGKDLQKKFGTAVLLKGGHLPGDYAIDLLFIDGRIVEFSAPRIFGVATHGTGCTYSAAITAGVACGRPLEEAISKAKKVTIESIRTHYKWGDLHALNHSI
jgi:hydroxymethylpyrimidine/phosphomethylpyrimidine kinase